MYFSSCIEVDFSLFITLTHNYAFTFFEINICYIKINQFSYTNPCGRKNINNGKIT